MEHPLGWKRGPSPRGRGNRCLDDESWVIQGSIPAWAGKPRRYPMRRSGARVHPRVGGETRYKHALAGVTEGPSPRGRGNHRHEGASEAVAGSIPAWAGKPACAPAPSSTSAVHPRVGGETTWIATSRAACDGPSPRGRGNHRRVGVSRLYSGSIPAWAGKPPGYLVAVPYQTGPSPRGRGNPHLAGGTLTLTGSIPAWAGKPKVGYRALMSCRVHPRVGGETAVFPIAPSPASGPSPRGRGNPHRPARRLRGRRSIPAWAGKPQLQRAGEPRTAVHPRVGGETGYAQQTYANWQGPSPRGRGNQGLQAPAPRRDGSIPAWAGKPSPQTTCPQR